jgi:hypothetical protein
MKPNSSPTLISKWTSAMRVSLMLTLAMMCSAYSMVRPAARNSVGSQGSHVVGSRIELGPTDRELTLLFNVVPATRAVPIVRLLGPASRSKTLEVKSGSAGHYSARLADLQDVSSGQVHIEVADEEKGPHALHGADFALQEIATNGPTSSPSRDGHFVLYTLPDGISRGSRLLISGGELPIDALPAAVASNAVVGVYFLDSTASLSKAQGWRLALATPPDKGKVSLFYLPKGDKTWKPLESKSIEGHPLQDAAFAGPGTYLLVRGAKR